MLFRSDPLDTMDVRYINYSYAPIPSPLKKSLEIELFNDTYFPAHSEVIQDPTTYKTSSLLDHLAFEQHNHSDVNILPPTDNTTTPPTELDQNITSPPLDSLLQRITSSADKLFFIKYTPPNTLLQRWYLIEVDMESTKTVNPSFATNHKYWCVFQAKHTADEKKSDEYSRWWPEWYRYHTDAATQLVVYDYRVHILPDRTPSSLTHVQWATLIPLFGPSSISLLGPTVFQPCGEITQTKRTLQLDNLHQLKKICDANGLLPPTFGSNDLIAPPITRRKKRKG